MRIRRRGAEPQTPEAPEPVGARVDFGYYTPTGAQAKGPQWLGRRPRRASVPRRSRYSVLSTAEPQSYAARTSPRDAMITPNSGLERLLLSVKRRSTRRLILAAVTSRNPRRASRLEKQVRAALEAEAAR